MSIEWTVIVAMFITGALMKAWTRWLEWKYPPGYHSKSVSRYGVRHEDDDPDPTEEDTTDDP